MTYFELLDALRARSGGGAKYGLERMQALLEALDHPEQRFASWHIAGTNGKGSVAAMLEAIARQAGARTGLNTSPHLNRLRERIRLDGEEISEQAMVEVFERVERGRLAAGLEATFFETLTAMAFVSFAARPVDRAVVEVGLGGRLDATKLLPSEVAAVVSISLDHTRILGTSEALIAAEKAAIARPGRPLVVGPITGSALESVLEVATTIGARPVLVSDHLRFDGSARVEHAAGTVVLEPALPGSHQLENAAVAALVALEGGVPARAVAEGIRRTRWRGRLERTRWQGREYLLDCAHNLAGARALAASAGPELAAGYQLVIATSGGRDTGALVASLAETAGWPREIRVCRPEGHRLSDPQEVAERIRPVLPEAVQLSVVADPEEALAAGQGDLLTLVTGSMYLVGQALAILNGEERDPFETGR